MKVFRFCKKYRVGEIRPSQRIKKKYQKERKFKSSFSSNDSRKKNDKNSSHIYPYQLDSELEECIIDKIDFQQIHPSKAQNWSIEIGKNYPERVVTWFLDHWEDRISITDEHIKHLAKRGMLNILNQWIEKNYLTDQHIRLAFIESARNNQRDFLIHMLQNELVQDSCIMKEAFVSACSCGAEDVINYFIEKDILQRLDGAADQAFCAAADHGQVKIVQQLLQLEYVNPATNDNHAIRWACKKGYKDICEVLLHDNRVNPNVHGEPLQWAAEGGYDDIVELLLNDPRVNPMQGIKEKPNEAPERKNPLIGSIDCGHSKVAEILLTSSSIDPSLHNNLAIQKAAENGLLEVVKLLLMDKRVEPSANENYALKWASLLEFNEITLMLLKHQKHH